MVIGTTYYQDDMMDVAAANPDVLFITWAGFETAENVGAAGRRLRLVPRWGIVVGLLLVVGTTSVATPPAQAACHRFTDWRTQSERKTHLG